MTVTPVGSVHDGKVTDFLTSKLVDVTAEEFVRQNLEKALVRQYKYAPKDCEPEGQPSAMRDRTRAGTFPV
jgi:type I restriction enzyme M protein